MDFIQKFYNALIILCGLLTIIQCQNSTSYPFRSCMMKKYSCQNNGECIVRPSVPNSYVCSCPTPYCGTTCRNRRPNCNEEPIPFNCMDPEEKCQNGGKCIIFALKGYLCSCPRGFCGNMCNMKAPNCLS